MNGTVLFSCIVEDQYVWYYHGFFTVVSFSLPLFILVALIYSLFWRDKHTLYVIGATLFNLMWVYSVKELVRIDRPIPNCFFVGHSLPSGHASTVTLLASYYMYSFWRYARDVWSTTALFLRIGTVLLYAVGVCFSRLTLKLNRIEDVVSGAILGAWGTILFLYVLQRHSYTSYKAAFKKD